MTLHAETTNLADWRGLHFPGFIAADVTALEAITAMEYGDVGYVADTGSGSPGYYFYGDDDAWHAFVLASVVTCRGQIVFTIEGANMDVGDVEVKPLNFCAPDLADATIEEVYIYANTAPAATATRFRILKNGATILSGTDYIELSIAANSVTRNSNFVSTSFAKNDRFQLELVQGDATIADVTVHIRYSYTATES